MGAYGISARLQAKKIFPHLSLYTSGTIFAVVLNVKTNDEVKIFVSHLFCFILRHQKAVGLHFQLLHLNYAP